MQDRFRFNAIVTGYYYIEEEGKEVEPQIYLKDVDLHSNGEISVSQDNLEKAIKKQYPDLKNSYIALIMEFFQNSSNHTEPLLLTPEKILQCTGLKDKTGKLIYEGDILDLYVSTKKLYRYQVKFEIGSFMLVSKDEIFDFRNKWNDNVYPLSQLYFEYQNEENSIWECEVIGNIYKNPELLEVVK